MMKKKSGIAGSNHPNLISGKLLIVDDFADIRMLLETAFKAAGHEVVTAADVQGAKEELEDADFDVVVTDLDLPDSNGIELTNWIRERGTDAEVIVITGHASMSTVSEALRLGAFDYLIRTPAPESDDISTKAAPKSTEPA